MFFCINESDKRKYGALASMLDEVPDLSVLRNVFRSELSAPLRISEAPTIFVETEIPRIVSFESHDLG